MIKTILQLCIKYKYIFFSLALALFAGLPLLHPGLMPTHDGEYHLIRFYEFDKMLHQGMLYPRWAPDLFFGYGIPLFTYMYPLPNYMASIFHFFGASFLDSVKLDMLAATITGALFFYLWTKRFWGSMGALVSSAFYTYAPYHFVDIYVRGSVGEAVALGIFPAFLWSYTTYADSKKPLHGILSVIFLALTIFSHNIVGLMFFAFTITYMGFCIFLSSDKKRLVFTSFLILLLSLGISSVFWIPALLETNYVTGLQVYNIQHNFPDLFQLLFPSWGTGFFGSSFGDEMSVQIGIANLLVVVLALFSLGKYLKKKQKALARTLVFFLAWFVMLFLLMLSVSLPVWTHVPLIHYFQFPWRLLSLVILVCAFFAGSLGSGKKATIIGVFLILLVVLITHSYTEPAYYMIRNDSYYITRSNFIDSTNSPGNAFNTIWNIPKTTRPTKLFVSQRHVIFSHTTKLSAIKFSTQTISTIPTEQVVNESYFPGWQVTIDGKVAFTYPKEGIIAFKLPQGKHIIMIALHETPTERLAKLLSFISVLLLFAIFLFRKKIRTLQM